MQYGLWKLVELLSAMKERGVVLYGAGVRGKRALEVLEKAGIRIVAMADKEVGKNFGGYLTVSLDTLCKNANNEVCIVTPLLPLTEEKERLKECYNIVTDIFIINWMQCFTPEDTAEMDYMDCHPFNHYESPFTSNEELRNFKSEGMYDMAGIDLNIEGQIGFVPSYKKNSADFFQAEEDNKLRYAKGNPMYPEADAALLHSMLRENCVKKIIEIGSGFSTCVMLDTNEYWMNHEMEIISIEPYPERLLKNMRETDKAHCTIIQDYVQNVSLEIFDSLKENDVLFIDSSHVTKCGGDVLHEYFNILPRLKSGVLIHIHDIFNEFSYPKEWLKQGRPYTEGFILRALLTNSNAYEILFFQHMMLCSHRTLMEEVLGSERMHGGSIWLRKK